MAAKDDQLVATVVKGIPREVVESGIYTEKALKEKFDVLECTATKVALVGRDGASLPVYFLPWLQSKLLFLKFSDIPKDELQNQATGFSQLDTYDILHGYPPLYLTHRIPHGPRKPARLPAPREPTERSAVRRRQTLGRRCACASRGRAGCAGGYGTRVRLRAVISVDFTIRIPRQLAYLR